MVTMCFCGLQILLRNRHTSMMGKYFDTVYYYSLVHMTWMCMCTHVCSRSIYFCCIPVVNMLQLMLPQSFHSPHHSRTRSTRNFKLKASHQILRRHLIQQLRHHKECSMYHHQTTGHQITICPKERLFPPLTAIVCLVHMQKWGCRSTVHQA